MSFLELKIPPVLFTILCIIGMTLWHYGSNYYFSIESAFSSRLIFCIVWWVVGGAVSLLGVSEFAKKETTVNPMKPSESSSLVQSGIYSVTRNPMYVGFLCLVIGWSFFLMDVSTMALFVPFFIWYLTRFQIIPEERILEGIFGNQFVTYKNKVNRWMFI